MHRPVLKDSGVLYPQIEGYQGADEGGISKIQVDPKFVAKSKTDFNSPTNIRRVFITYSGVWVHYYVPYKTANNTGRHFTSKQYELPDNCKCSNMYEVIEHMVSREAEIQQYMNEKTVNRNAVAPDEYVIKGNVFGAFSNNYACNNIEEIYFDWSIIMAEELMPLFANTNFRVSNIGAFVTGNAPKLIQDKDTFIKAFEQFNSNGNTKNVLDRFPRLKVIGFVSNLDAIMKLDSGVNNALGMIKDFENSTKSWYILNSGIIKASNSSVSINTINRANPNKQFKVKDTQYKFDKEVLKLFTVAYQKKVDDFNRLAKYGKQHDKDSNGDAGQESSKVRVTAAEQYINSLYNNFSPDDCEAILRIATFGKSDTDKSNLLVELSKNNRERVAKAINYNLSNITKGGK
jgi:hypothetical protein